MNLKDFVAESLTEIFEGVKIAQEKLGKEKGEINPAPMGSSNDFTSRGRFMPFGNRKIGGFVEFDVAITVNEGTQTQGGIGVVGGIINLGSKGESTESNESASRIKFSVPVVLP